MIEKYKVIRLGSVYVVAQAGVSPDGTPTSHTTGNYNVIAEAASWSAAFKIKDSLNATDPA